MNALAEYVANIRYETHNIARQLRTLQKLISEDKLDLETIKLNMDDLREQVYTINSEFTDLAVAIDEALSEDEGESNDTTVQYGSSGTSETQCENSSCGTSGEAQLQPGSSGSLQDDRGGEDSPGSGSSCSGIGADRIRDESICGLPQTEEAGSGPGTAEGE